MESLIPSEHLYMKNVLQSIACAFLSNCPSSVKETVTLPAAFLNDLKKT